MTSNNTPSVDSERTVKWHDLIARITKGWWPHRIAEQCMRLADEEHAALVQENLRLRNLLAAEVGMGEGAAAAFAGDGVYTAADSDLISAMQRPSGAEVCTECGANNGEHGLVDGEYCPTARRAILESDDRADGGVA